MRQHLLDGPPALDERECALVTDPAHTGHVIRGVADQREIVHHALGWHAETFVRVLDAVPLLGGAPGRSVPGVEYPDLGSHQLQEILVARDDADLEVLRDPLLSECGDHVVGLEPIERDRRDAVAREDLLDAFDAGVEVALLVLGKRDTVRLVGREQFLASR